MPSRVRIRLAESERPALERADKRSPVLKIIRLFGGVLLEDREDLGRIGELGHVEGEEEFERGIRCGSE
jgi:hypothetical protein